MRWMEPVGRMRGMRHARRVCWGNMKQKYLGVGGRILLIMTLKKE